MLVEITAKRGMFCNPIFKMERMTYPVPTPGALEYLLRNIYWKPQIDIRIKRIYVINRPQYQCVMKNWALKKADGKKSKQLPMNCPRTETILTNLRYYVDFDFVLTGINSEEGDCLEKHIAIFRRRVDKGQYYQPPYMGCREYDCEVRMATEEEIPESENKGITPLGLMLHHVEHKDDQHTPVFYSPLMVDGVINTLHIRQHTQPEEEGDVLKNLINLYDMYADDLEMPKEGYENAKITYEAVLSEEGELLDFKPLATGQKGNPIPQTRIVPLGAVKSCNIAANFLWGNAEYLFGLGYDRTEDKIKAFTDKIRDVIGDRECLPVVRPVLKFYESLNIVTGMIDEYKTMIEPYLTIKTKKRNGSMVSYMSMDGNIVFRIYRDDKSVLEHTEVLEMWEDYYRHNRTGERGICLITGMEYLLADKHPLVKGVNTSSNMGRLLSADSATTSLVSYGINSLAPVGQESSYKLHTALNWLLASDTNKVDTTHGTIVFWSRYNNPALARNLQALFRVPGAEYTPYAVPEGEVYYILELRPNTLGRVYIRTYQRFVYGDNSTEEMLHMLDRMDDVAVDYDIMEKWEDQKLFMRSENQTNAYALGKLMAEIEIAQKDAIPSTARDGGTSITAKYYQMALSRPSIAFAHLLSQMRIYLEKTDYGIGEEIGATLQQLGNYEVPYPETFTHTERCMFMHGYQQNIQRLNRERWERIEAAKKRKEEKNNKIITEEDEE